MTNPISSVRSSETQRDSQAPAPKPDHAQAKTQTPVTVKSGEVSGDQVTLKSAGNVNSDNQ
jgi:hypothetical protein